MEGTEAGSTGPLEQKVKARVVTLQQIEPVMEHCKHLVMKGLPSNFKMVFELSQAGTDALDCMEAVLAWVAGDASSRLADLPELLAAMRLAGGAQLRHAAAGGRSTAIS
ncbi:hypothetical protein WJX72_009348 [[Myrmecia] bisecta]|uniref:Uncharacterized protein n=1 Tax=[Myrmecia] bisecta TaxID=41462 RepID=A0AAW1P4Y9_9CHLO